MHKRLNEEINKIDRYRENIRNHMWNDVLKEKLTNKVKYKSTI